MSFCRKSQIINEELWTNGRLEDGGRQPSRISLKGIYVAVIGRLPKRFVLPSTRETHFFDIDVWICFEQVQKSVFNLTVGYDTLFEVEQNT